MNTLKEKALWLGPVLIMVLLAPFTSHLDLWISHLAFDSEWDMGNQCSSSPGFFSNRFFDFVYLWGVLPAQLLCAIATLILLMAPFLKRIHKYKPILWVLSLNLLIGSGLITHGILKEFWGRPRPRQIVEFGGSQQFRPFYSPSLKKNPEPSKSFPCGHCTTGFYFFGIYFLGKRYQNSLLSYSGLILSILLGGTISIARIVQGGHFFSDILMSALIMWLTALIIDWFVFERWRHSLLINKKDYHTKLL